MLPELFTHHEAEPVVSGPPKLAANLWIHARAYTAELGKHCGHSYDPDHPYHVEEWRRARRARGLDDALPASMRNETIKEARRAAMREQQGGDTTPLSQGFFFVGIGILAARILGLF